MFCGNNEDKHKKHVLCFSGKGNGFMEGFFDVQYMYNIFPKRPGMVRPPALVF